MSATATAAVSLFGLDPNTYVPHELHSGERAYPETNCYADILIELVHAAGHEPLAMLGSSMAVDFEGDQWTFFKPQPDEIELLYGIDIHEMQPYRPLPDQIAEQIEQGRTLIVELDSFYLPDVAGTSYRRAHIKSSAVMETIDREGARLQYFHNGSLHALEGEDYRNIFRVGREFLPDVLPPYTELVRFDRGRALRGDELVEAARELLRRQLARRPTSNPFIRYGDALEGDLFEVAARRRRRLPRLCLRHGADGGRSVRGLCLARRLAVPAVRSRGGAVAAVDRGRLQDSLLQARASPCVRSRAASHGVGRGLGTLAGAARPPCELRPSTPEA